jgi:uncharacterized membrane protein
LKRLFKSIYFNLHLILSIFFLLYVAIPLLAPVFLHSSSPQVGWWIHTIYHFACHQRPERSLFFFGEHLTYTTDQLVNNGYRGSIIGYPFVGNAEMGYKTALCVRDLFMYTSIGITGVLICMNKLRVTLNKWLILFGLAPMILDGGIQFISELLYYTQDRWGLELAKPFYISNNVTRAVTGTLFGITFGIIMIGELKKILTSEQTWDKNQKPQL